MSWIDALVPFGRCLHCQEGRADTAPWLCGGCAITIHEDDEETTDIAGVSLQTPWLYSGAIATLLTRAKSPLEPAIYHWLLDRAKVLPTAASFVPVPTPWRRRLKRRGCHTTALATALAARCGGRVVHALRRRHQSVPQASLGAEQRRAMPTDAFVLLRRVSHGPVVLVDDVVTTGTTVRTALTALQPALRDAELALSLFALARVAH
jgi:predicted amidophosphoribosyltransferase